jgi:FkbM family methyltransferase
MSLASAIPAILHDAWRIGRRAGSLASGIRWTNDRIVLGLAGRLGATPRERLRALDLPEGVRLSYRRNRGDMQAIREVWLDESYRLAPGFKPAVLVDLGANIGMTSLWLARRYGIAQVVAVEPDPGNALLLRRNLAQNGMRAVVVEAAISPSDGTAFLTQDAASNMRRLGSAGQPVRTISMRALLRDALPGDEIALLKVDIEGAEWALFTQGDLSWAAKVGDIIIECHPSVIDYAGLIEAIVSLGFVHYPAGSRTAPIMDYFRRKDLPGLS